MKYKPITNNELKAFVENNSIYLGDIDTSKITDMSYLFAHSTRKDFSGIETWDVSNVTNMNGMFLNARHFNHNISSWEIDSVRTMDDIFLNSGIRDDYRPHDLILQDRLVEQFLFQQTIIQDMEDIFLNHFKKKGNNCADEDIENIAKPHKNSPTMSIQSLLDYCIDKDALFFPFDKNSLEEKAFHKKFTQTVARMSNGEIKKLLASIREKNKQLEKLLFDIRNGDKDAIEKCGKMLFGDTNKLDSSALESIKQNGLSLNEPPVVDLNNTSKSIANRDFRNI